MDLRWHHPKEFKALLSDKKDELTAWQKTQEGKKVLEKSREAADKKRKQEAEAKESGTKSSGGGSWKKRLKKAVKTQNGIKTIMSVLAAEETRNKEVLNALTTAKAASGTAAPSATAGATNAIPKEVIIPATSLKLSFILNNKK